TQKIDPGLLQQGEEDDRAAGGETSAAGRPSGGALFSVKVAPIPAYGTKRLEMQFQQEVPFIESLGEFRLGLRPSDGEPTLARTLSVRVRLDEGTFVPGTAGLPLSAEGPELTFTGRDVKLERDLVVRIAPQAGAPLHLASFRNPEGALPDGL